MTLPKDRFFRSKLLGFFFSELCLEPAQSFKGTAPVPKPGNPKGEAFWSLIIWICYSHLKFEHCLGIHSFTIRIFSSSWCSLGADQMNQTLLLTTEQSTSLKSHCAVGAFPAIDPVLGRKARPLSLLQFSFIKCTPCPWHHKQCWAWCWFDGSFLF